LQDAEEIAADTIMKVISKIDKWDQRGDFKNWVAVICWNTSKDYFRSNINKVVSYTDDTRDIIIDILETNWVLRYEWVLRIVERDDTFRHLRQKYLEGYTYKDMGEMYKVAQSSVRTVVHRQMIKLRKRINEVINGN